MVAREFGVLPSAARRDMENDPEEFTLQCFMLLRYADAHREYKGVKTQNELNKLKSKHRLVRTVEEIEFAIAAEEIGED